MTYYVFHQSNGFDRNQAEQYDTIESAARSILGYDMQDSGMGFVDNQFVPWQRPHRGPTKLLHALAADNEADAWKNVAMSEDFPLECFNEDTAAQYEADADACHRKTPDILHRARS